jgi:RNA polymerase sigma-70 factor, ECF subfamily
VRMHSGTGEGPAEKAAQRLPFRRDMDADRALVNRCIGGDLSAFEELVDRHRDVVLRVAARIVGQSDAEDVTQDAFLRAFHRLQRFRGDATFRAWLLQITHNAAVDHLNRRRGEPVDDDAPHDVPVDELERMPAERLEQRERARRLEKKLRALSPEHRAVLVLRDIEGFSYDEIAQITSAPLGTVKVRVHRARRDLIELLRTNTYDWELPA